MHFEVESAAPFLGLFFDFENMEHLVCIFGGNGHRIPSNTMVSVCKNKLGKGSVKLYITILGMCS